MEEPRWTAVRLPESKVLATAKPEARPTRAASAREPSGLRRTMDRRPVPPAQVAAVLKLALVIEGNPDPAS
ncbi:MAG: hypothetical protein RIS76_1360 [Verrucomicrobiota bacterium]|jgi:hypothetical protein